jgi:hypothetical protein
MKTNLFYLSLILFTFSSVAFGQSTSITESKPKSKFFVGGGMSFDVNSESSASYIIEPEVGYFVNPKSAFGAGVSYFSVPGTNTDLSGWHLNAFNRYYAYNFAKLSFFWESTLCFGYEKYRTGRMSNASEFNLIGISVVPGLSYELKDGLCFIAKFGGVSASMYKSIKNTAYPFYSTDPFYDFKFNFLTSGLTLGVVARL